MGKGFSTRQHIVEASAGVMNVRGYCSTSVAEIMTATGLTKGGLYNHFTTRDEIAGAAFDYAAHLSLDFMHAIERRTGPASERLLALFDAYRNYGTKFPLKGGCPLLRGAVEGANGPDWLKHRSRSALREMIRIFERLLYEGKNDGSLVANASPTSVANAIVASLEGAVMLSGLFKDAAPSHDTLDVLENMVRNLLVRP